jgi:hypothetical protein
MKKNTPVFLAVLLAAGLSTAALPAPPPPYYYKTATGYAVFTGTVCPEGTMAICIRHQPGVGFVVVLKSQNDNDVLRYNP